jgi:hypothetical protein
MTMNDGKDRSDLTASEKEVVGQPGDLVSEDPVAPRPKSDTVMISLRIERPVFDELGRLSEAGGRTFSETARDALRTYVRARATSAVPCGPAEAHRGSSHGASERVASTWSDEDLAAALGRYERACRQASMRQNASRSYVDYARRFLAWRTGDYRPRGVIAGERPVPRAAASTGDLRDQAARYAEQVQDAGREQPTVDTYFRHAMFFIRWLEGEFQPGARLHGLR